MLPIGRSHAEYLAHLDQWADRYCPRAGDEELLLRLRPLNMEPAAALLRPFLYGRLWLARASARRDVAVVRRDDPGRRHLDPGVGEDAFERTVLRGGLGLHPRRHPGSGHVL